jgi:hypothetical protein
MNILILSTTYAYARGYFDGRANGVENNPYSGDNDVENEEHLYYKRGYSDGVTDFCEFDEDGK